MRHLNKIITVLLLSAVTISVQAQEEDLTQRNIVSGNTIYTTNNNAYTGSPLLKESFENGRILFTNNGVSEMVPINYDTHKNQVLFIKNNEIRVLSMGGVKGFVFEKSDESQKVQERFTLGLNIPGKKISKQAALQVLYQGEVKLLAHHQTSLMKGNSPDPYTGKITDRYVSKTNYYIQKKNGEFVGTKLRIKNIIKDLPRKHRKELRKFAKENDLDNRSEVDIVKLLTFYDEIN